MYKKIIILFFVIILTSCSSKDITSDNLPKNKYNNIDNKELSREELLKREKVLEDRTQKRIERNKKFEWLTKEDLIEIDEKEKQEEIIPEEFTNRDE